MAEKEIKEKVIETPNLEEKEKSDKIIVETEKKEVVDSDTKIETQEEVPGDPEPKEESYKKFETKEEFSSYMNKKTKKLKTTIEEQKATIDEKNKIIKDLKNQIAKKKLAKKIIFVKPQTKTKTKQGEKPKGQA